MYKIINKYNIKNKIKYFKYNKYFKYKKNNQCKIKRKQLVTQTVR